ncbi:MAG: ATP-binding protein [Coriobacteriales bacterium]|nr:ATP-binding protein [Coriobacteriales bacterium]
MFIGREYEIGELERLYSSHVFEMAVIYGRRRIGKTRLITEFIRNKPAIYFQARRTNAQTNLQLLSQAILSYTSQISHAIFATFDEAFETILEMSRDKRLVLVIDEFPYLAQSFPEISSLLQEKIDHKFKEQSELMLILCGSSLSFMEEQVLGYESPLYGRRTAQFKLEPFDFFTAKQCWKGFNNTDAAVLYACTGGIPAYIEQIDNNQSLEQNITRLFLTPSGYLFEEPGNLLLQECKTPMQYDAIIQAIASGKSKVSEIASATKIPDSNTNMYLNKLITLGIVKRELPYGETSNKKAVYALQDQMFRFWYRFIPANQGLILNNMPDAVFKRIEPYLSEYMGLVFEEICKQYLLSQAQQGRYDVVPALTQRWWGNNPHTKSQDEIDLIVDDTQGAMLFVECKWRNQPSSADILEKLIDRSSLFTYKSAYYQVFSKSGFTETCKELARSLQNTTLTTFEDMCKFL